MFNQIIPTEFRQELDAAFAYRLACTLLFPHHQIQLQSNGLEIRPIFGPALHSN